MDPLTVGLSLASLVPEILKYFGKGKDAEVADKVINIAKKVTGADDPDVALTSLKLDQSKLIEFKKALLDQEVELAKISATIVEKVNDTIQVEAKADHWPTYSWRPFIGFSFGAYINSLWLLPLFGVQPVVMTPDTVIAIGAILGVASWFRGKMQADPNLPTDNRG